MRQSFSTQPALFAPQELYDHPALKVLDEVEALIDWGRIEALLPRGEDAQATGRLGYPALTMFRALLLGLWYDLSDVKLSQQRARDLLFRTFCRLEIDQGVPDDTTLGRYRKRLGNRLPALLETVVAMLEEQRVILAEGRIAVVDATVMEAAQSGIKTADPEAGSAVKVTVKGRKQAVWGWQGFVNADEDGFIRRITVSPGNEAEVDSLFDGLVVGDESALYADKANSSHRTREMMHRYGIRDRVQKRGAAYKRLTLQDHARNIEIGVTRGRVEAIFGHMKRHWGLRRSRFMGLRKTTIQFTLAAIGWNLWKGAGFRTKFG